MYNPNRSIDSIREERDRFVAFAVFENPDGTLRPGDLARAKIYAARASVLSRGWRVLRRWLQTIVW